MMLNEIVGQLEFDRINALIAGRILDDAGAFGGPGAQLVEWAYAAAARWVARQMPCITESIQ